MKALEGIRVLDLTRALAGPFCTLMLGDNGADVIKIEIPNTGDDTRHWGPPFIQDESAYFLSINRNKRSLTLNLRDPDAKEVFLKLAKNADAIVENFTPGVMGRFGLDYNSIKNVNPSIIYCSISGFGQDGPYKDRPAYDQIMQGVSGLMSITGEPDGEPQKIGLAVPDIGSGMRGAFAIMAALNHRQRSGAGQYIDISMMDAQISWLTYQAAYFFAYGEAPKRLGAAHPTLVPYQGFMCQDGKYINVAVGSERIWERFCQAMNLMHMWDDPLYAINSDRVNQRGKIVPLLQEIFLTRPVAEWVDDLQSANVPCGPINMLQEINHPTLGSIKQTGLPIKFSETPGGLDRHPPLLGEHNHEILEELGYSGQEIKQLEEKSVI